MRAVSKTVFTLVFLAMTAFTLLSWSTAEIGKNSNPCEIELLKKIAPWASGCFYTALFNNQTATQEQINFEKQMLDRFVEKEGASQQILWYRSKFYQRYRSIFRTNFQQLHFMHQDYTRAEHTKLAIQVDYLLFLVKHDLQPLAQKTINKFCTTYVPRNRSDLVDELEWRLKQQSLLLSLEQCRMITSSKW